jgi:hypothetical protein
MPSRPARAGKALPSKKAGKALPTSEQADKTLAMRECARVRRYSIFYLAREGPITVARKLDRTATV